MFSSGIIINAKTSPSGIINGAIVASCTETGYFSRPSDALQVNTFVPSGRLITWYSNRFDEYYMGGGPKN